MIARIFAAALVAFLLGFLVFAFTLGKPAPASERSDAAVVLTGGAGRIEHAIDVLEQGKVRRVLIAGTDPSVTKVDLARRLGGKGRLIRCCVDLGSESVDTRSNAEEADRWLAKHHFRSVRLITSDYHMRRARYEFDLVLGDKYTLTSDAVRSDPNFAKLFGDYYKYVLRRLAVWIDL